VKNKSQFLLVTILFCIISIQSVQAQGWQQYGLGGQMPSLYALSAVNDSVCWFAGDLMMTFLVQLRSTGNSYGWSQNGLEPAAYTAIYGRSATLAYTASDNGKIFKTTNGGTSWIKQFTHEGGTFIDGIYFWTDSVGIAYGDPVSSSGFTQFTMFRTTNGGATWNNMTTAMPVVTSQYSHTQSLDAVGTHLWFPTNADNDTTIARYIFHSRDRGLTWEKLNIPTNFGDFNVSFSDSSNGIIANLYNKTARTSDGGKTWSVKYNGVGRTGLKVFKGTSSVWIQGYYDKQVGNYPIFYSTDYGTTWGKQPRNSPVSIVGFSAASLNVVWACGFNYLVLRNATANIATSVSPQQNKMNLPSSFELNQNYPNPFNPTTTIKYHIGNTGSTKLVVYDQLGRNIRTLVDDVQSTGWHMVVWDGRNNNRTTVSTGTYYYRIENNGQIGIKKMLFLK
jgi:photosystem II stability/assembly factor-like uncharacterized protein